MPIVTKVFRDFVGVYNRYIYTENWNFLSILKELHSIYG